MPGSSSRNLGAHLSCHAAIAIATLPPSAAASTACDYQNTCEKNRTACPAIHDLDAEYELGLHSIHLVGKSTLVVYTVVYIPHSHNIHLFTFTKRHCGLIIHGQSWSIQRSSVAGTSAQGSVQADAPVCRRNGARDISLGFAPWAARSQVDDRGPRGPPRLRPSPNPRHSRFPPPRQCPARSTRRRSPCGRTCGPRRPPGRASTASPTA